MDKKHKLLTLILLITIIGYILLQQYISSRIQISNFNLPIALAGITSESIKIAPGPGYEALKKTRLPFPGSQDSYPPQAGIKDRMVIQESNLSPSKKCSRSKR